MRSDEIRNIVNDLLADSVAAHKRRCAIRQGKREPDTTGCCHGNWDVLRCWCNDCGITLQEIVAEYRKHYGAQS